MMCREARCTMSRLSDTMKGLPKVISLSFRKDTSATFQSANGSPKAEQPPLESTSKEAFFNRVETFSISFFSLCELHLLPALGIVIPTGITPLTLMF